MTNSRIQQLLKNDLFTVIDAGARNGFRDFTPFNDCIAITGFEPDLKEAAKLQDYTYPSSGFKRYHAVSKALSDKEGSSDFYITKNPSMSGFLEPDEQPYNRIFGLINGSFNWKEQLQFKERINVATTTLDNYCSENQIPKIDFLKLDTQGSELDVLKGAGKLLGEGNISIIKTEIALLPIYKNQCSFAELEFELKKHHFQLIDCLFYPTNVIDVGKQAVKEKLKLKEKTRLYPVGDAIYLLEAERMSPGQALRSGILLAYMGYAGCALHVLKTRSGLDKTSLNELASEIQQFNTSLKKYPLRDFIPPILWKLLKKLQGN